MMLKTIQASIYNPAPKKRKKHKGIAEINEALFIKALRDGSGYQIG